MKVLVIGGGIGGVTAAVALQRRGIEAEVFESADELEPLGKGIWVPTNAMRVLERLGLAAGVARRGIPLERIELRDRDEGVLVDLNLERVRRAYRHTTVSIHRALLHEALLGHLRPGSFHLRKHCERIVQGVAGIEARFRDGTRASGDALVGADGLDSAVRRTLFPGAGLRYSGQTCYLGIATLTLPPVLSRTCWDVWGGESRFGFSPIGPTRVYWFAPVTAAAGGAEPGDVMRAALARRYADFPSPVPEILAHTAPGELVRTDLSDLAPLPRWWQGRAVLLGDAAHAMTPNLGQGGAQAIEDAFALAQALSRGGALDDAFAHYERTRRPRVGRIVRAARRYGRLAHLRSRFLQRARNFALHALPERVNERQADWLYAGGPR